MITKDWRPDNWGRIKENIVNEAQVPFSPSTGYSKDQKDIIIEKTANVLLAALAEVLVTDNKE